MNQSIEENEKDKRAKKQAWDEEQPKLRADCESQVGKYWQPPDYDYFLGGSTNGGCQDKT